MREAQHLGRRARAAAGQEIDLVEHLEGEDQAEERTVTAMVGRIIGKRDVGAASCQPRGAVDPAPPRRRPAAAIRARRAAAGSRTASSARHRPRSPSRAPAMRSPSQSSGVDAEQRRVTDVDDAEIEVEHQLPDRADRRCRGSGSAAGTPCDTAVWPCAMPLVSSASTKPNSICSATATDGEDQGVDDARAQQPVARELGVMAQAGEGPAHAVRRSRRCRAGSARAGSRRGAA